jgi:hypothetical protein
VSSDLVDVYVFSLFAMLNPSLIAAVTVMLLFPDPKRLMIGYLLGAYLTSITLGLVFVFALPGSSTEATSKQTIGPVEDLIVGLLLWALAFVLGTGRDRPFRERRAEKTEAKRRAKEEAGKPTESLPLRLLGKGDPKVSFIVGVVLSFPGISYLDSLDHIHRLNPGTVATVLLVISVCVIQLLFLELPLLGYAFSPDRTRRTVTGFKDWMSRRGRTAAVIGACALGAWLIIRGLINLL